MSEHERTEPVTPPELKRAPARRTRQAHEQRIEDDELERAESGVTILNGGA